MFTEDKTHFSLAHSLLRAACIILFLAACVIVMRSTHVKALIISDIPNGPNVISNIDQQCYNRLDGTYPSPLNRSEVNNSGQYWNTYWISPLGSPSSGSIQTIPYSQRNNPVLLQYNGVEFVCYALVKSHSLVTTGNFPNDSQPNPDAGVFGESLVDQVQYLKPGSITATCGTVNGAIQSVNAIDIAQDTNSRYWFNNPVTFDYTATGCPLVVGNNVINVQFSGTNIAVFHTSLANGGVLQCKKAGGGMATLGNTRNAQTVDYSPCQTSTYTFSINIVVQPQPPPPKVTFSNSCSPSPIINGNVTAGGSPLAGAQVTTNGYGTYTSDTKGNFSIDMTNYDELLNQSVSMTPFYALGGSGPTKTSSFGPCYSLSCGSIVLTIPGVVNPTEPAVGQPFNLTAIVNFNPVAGAPANPKTVGGSMYITYGTQPTVHSPTPGSPYTASFIQSTPGLNIPYNYYYIDGPAVAPPGAPAKQCPGGIVSIGYQPYINVTGGSISTGSGGFNEVSGPGCNGTNTNAGLLAYNTSNGSHVFNSNQGSSGNLAAFAPNLVDGYETAYNTGVPTTMDGLTFANIGGIRAGLGTNQDTLYGGGFGTSFSGSCINDYYHQAASYFGSATAVTSSPVDITNVANKASLNCRDAGIGTIITTYCYLSASAGGYVALVDSSLPFSNNLVIVVNGDVAIQSDLNINKNGWTSTNISSLTVISQGNIFINPSVSAIDGTYIAENKTTSTGGGIYSCANNNQPWPKSGISRLYTNCNHQLTIDGALIADQVHLNRTFGNIVNAGQPAENFTYNSNIWMQNPLSNGSNTPLTPIYQSITALPPVL